LNTGTSDPRAARQFRVRYTTGQPARSGQPVSNTFGLTGEGTLTFDGHTLVFERVLTADEIAAHGAHPNNC